LKKEDKKPHLPENFEKEAELTMTPPLVKGYWGWLKTIIE
jgi:hypothetical protein